MKRKSILTLVAAVVILAVVIAGAFATANNPVSEDSPSRMFSTFWALIPPIVAIALALITKEVYSSLFVGVVLGGLMASNFSFAGTVDAVVNDGLIASVADSAGIFVFLVILGIIVALVNRAGGSQAFGRWASAHIRTKVGAALATFLLGVLIFIDDYFNCLTVGSVMRPLTDEKKISRVKLAYLIDATAAPVCMIAPISSWAAAVSGCVESETYSGLQLFVKAIPFNFYSLLTFVFIITISIMGFDYGKMAGFEIRAQSGDIVGNTEDIASNDEKPLTDRGRVIDLVLPVVILIVTCVLGLLYVGGFFGGDYAGDFIGAFGNTDAYVGLPWGGIIALIIIVAYMLLRRVLSFKEAMQCVPQGFIAMVPPILILTLATSLKNMTGLLGAKYFVAGVMEQAAAGLFAFLPAVIFLVACALSFATGTSWGTFGILIPIVTNIFPETSPLLFVGVSACLAGAVCGDHCSPISDTTIMSSAGAQCNHVDHVATQLPYALTVAALSFVCFIIAGFLPNAWVVLPIGAVLTIGTLFLLKLIQNSKLEQLDKE
ncbi:MAG: Na+/H+ antiporter NhaC family protein [Ruminococcaceae bacterium]|jgi:Na+/H+ antiporter NhaC|nr:Na+/H+ antiporter NhaC family protein [Oscillospiraceae bacterium]